VGQIPSSEASASLLFEASSPCSEDQVSGPNSKQIIPLYILDKYFLEIELNTFPPIRADVSQVISSLQVF
jgi:hypothetical protein